MLFKDGQTILFTGDSITDCGRDRPLGAHLGLGQGYVAFLNAMLAARHPEVNVRILNTGIGGNRINDLEKRWTADVMAHKPDWLSVMIGINDVWRHFAQPLLPVQITREMFEQVYRGLVVRTADVTRNLILGTPYYIEPNPDDPMRKMMDSFGAVVKDLADEYGAVLVDTQAAFDRVLEHRAVQSLCGDRVHPNWVGHMVLAEAFYAAINS